MTPSPNEPPDRSLFALSANEFLVRHQLNTLENWSVVLQPDKETNTKHECHAEMPSQWTLLAGIHLRDWQKECSDKWFENNKRGVVKVVTGAGKTILACAIIQRLQNIESPNLHVAIVVPTVVLLDQWYELFMERSNLPPSAIGRLGGGWQDSFDENRRILICVLNSAASKLPKLTAAIQAPVLLIIDECHRAGAKQMSEVFQVNTAIRLGLSATPERTNDAPDEEDSSPDDAEQIDEENFDESLLGRELGPIVFEFGYARAAQENILATFTLNHYGLPLETTERTSYEKISREISDLRRTLQSQMSKKGRDGGMLVGWARKVASRGGSELAHQAANYVALTGQRKRLVYHARARESAVKQLVKQSLQDSPDTRILLFHESVSEVMRLFALLRREGVPIVAENSQLPDTLRSESLRLFRTGAARVLISARSLIEGFDVPAADVGIVVASSSSVRQRIQTLGRILRKKTGETRAATLHVLYMAETTDEMIYQKEDWSSITGAERNRYYVWDPTTPDSEPVERERPPRQPKPTEHKVDWTTVSPGQDYPGAYEGNEYTCDSQGNVRLLDGTLAENPQGVPDLIHRWKGTFGRFKVTPSKRAILVTRAEPNRLTFAGFLAEPFKFNPSNTNSETGRATEMFVRAKAGGHRIAIKVTDGEMFARNRDGAQDAARGLEAENLSKQIQDVEVQTGKPIRKIRLLSSGEVVADIDGQQTILMTLTAGLEFADRKLP